MIVIGLGGNALQHRDEVPDAGVLRANVEQAAGALAGVVEHNSVVLTHGNGPQVGLLALQNAAFGGVRPYPLDVLGAETEGMIGYILEQELRARLPPGREVATLLTQVVVDRHDPAFGQPTKPIGPVYRSAAAVASARAAGWALARDGDGWRRVVASPEPRAVVEIAAIRLLVAAGVTVICAGGGGIPVVPDTHDRLRGVEAVIDKDLAASLLATCLDATALVLLTDVDGVHERWGGADARLIREATPSDLDALDLPPGTMGPKVAAISRFVRSGGRFGAIGALSDAAAVLNGHAGTTCRAAR